MYELFSFMSLLTFVLSFGLGIFTFIKNRASLLNVYWALTSIFTGFWSFGLWGVVSADRYQVGMFWQYLLDICAIFIPCFFLLFVLVLTGKYQEKKWLGFLTVFLSFGLSAFSFTKYFKLGIEPIMDFNFWVVAGPLYFLFPLWFFVLVVASFHLLIKEYKKVLGYKKNQLKYVIIFALIGFGAGPTNFLPQLFGIYPIGNFLLIFYIIFVAYAITKHRLMDIRVVMRNYSVYAVSLISVILPIVILKNFVDNSFQEITSWADYAFVIIAIAAFPDVKGFYYRTANKYFFSSLYDERLLVAELSDRLSSTLLVNKLYRYIIEVIEKAFHTKRLIFMVHDEAEAYYEISYRHNIAPVEPKGFAYDSVTGFLLQRQNRLIFLEDLRKNSYSQYKPLIDLMEAWGIEIILPLGIRNRVIGLLLLSEKESKDIYNDTDMRVLEIISVQAALAINNALSYEEIRNFNLKLKKKVEEATKELRDANQKLKQLDEAKSEFVSIASHQLRTPLTVIKGYISMMLEGSFGPVPDKQKESLVRVFESNERLIQLVENLLNISRIESGRLRFNFELLKMEDIVVSVIEELSGPAKTKGLKLVYDIPAVSLPLLLLDREKIRQVAMNLVDNSIKYTTEGTVTVRLRREKDDILFSVEDKGMGISSEDLPRLFTKFTRGSDTPLIHTEGTGLGLYVAKQMVEAHQGKIWAESEGVGQGSRFCFTIPIKRAERKPSAIEPKK